MATGYEALLEPLHRVKARIATKFAGVFGVLAFVFAIAVGLLASFDEAKRLEASIAVDLRPSFGRILFEELAITLVSTALFVGLASMAVYALADLLVAAPIRRVTAQAKAIASGNLEHRLAEQGSTEIRDLKRQINSMSDALEAAQRSTERATKARIDAIEKLRHADRLTTVGTLTAGIAHELGTPLTVIYAQAKNIERGSAAGDASSARMIREQAERMTKIVRQLLNFARRRQPDCRRGDLVATVNDAVELLRPLSKKRGITVTFESSSPVVDSCFDHGEIEQVVTNLLMNAFDAADAAHAAEEIDPSDLAHLMRWRSPSRTVSVRVVRLEEDDAAAIEVTDRGCGMDHATIERVFEPFFTTKDVGRGTGLGLSVVLGIVQDHGGRVDLRSEKGVGTTVTVTLPNTTRDAAPIAPERAPQPISVD